MQTAAVTGTASIGGPILVRREEVSAMDEAERCLKFEALYDATARPILQYLTGVTGRRDVAEDVLQETYCRYPGA